MLPEGRGVVLLDASCGGEANRGAIVTGLDRSLPILAAGRERANASGILALWCQGDVETLPFADASFDVVLAVTVLCMVNSPQWATLEQLGGQPANPYYDRGSAAEAEPSWVKHVSRILV